MSDGFDRCTHPGCARRVMRFKGHTLCLLHRGRPKYVRKRKSKRERAKENALALRRQRSAGVAWEGI